MNVSLAKLLSAKKMRFIDLARAIGVDKATVTRWGQKRIPAERIVEVESITGIPRHKLRPDLYPESTPQPVETAE